MKSVLKLPVYRRLLAAYTLNELAYSIGSLALAVLVYHRTGSALASAGYFLCAMFAPALVSPSVVARLDQRAARGVLVLLYALEAIVFGALAWVVGRFALAPVLALALVDGIIAVTARAVARTATVGITSAAGLLREGNAVANASFSFCYMVGPGLAGAVVALGGTVAALLANSGLFALIAVTLATTAGLPGEASSREPTKGRLRAAVAYARTNPLVRALLGLQVATWLFVSIPIPVEVILADRTLHGGAGGYGALLSAWGAGAVVGSAIYARWRGRPGRALIALGAMCMGVGFAVMAVAPTLAVAIVGAAVAGVGNGMIFVAGRTALQEATEISRMALLMSFSESITLGVPGAGILLGGALAAVAGPRPALWAGGAGALATAVAVWVMLRPMASETSPSATEESPPVGPLTEAARRRQAKEGGVYP